MKITASPRSRAWRMYLSTTPACLTPSAEVGSSRISTRRGEAHLGPVHEQPPGVVLVDAGEDLDEARLAGAVVPEDARHLARVDMRRDVVQSDDVAVVLRDALDLEQVRRAVRDRFD